MLKLGMNKKHRVLLIDDETDILQVVGFMLKLEGFEIAVAENGEAALMELSKSNFDIVICDYMMPRMDGITLLKKVREQKNYTPFIFFSGNADIEHEVKMIGLGAYQLLPKTEIADLVDVMKKTIKHNENIKIINESPGEQEDDFLNVLHSSGR
jgi:DNA-binding NtrC family response regulator